MSAFCVTLAAMATTDDSNKALNFAAVTRLERVHLRKADRAPLTGLALSGGGIRSATFNLGVLQALARARLLGTFDYLSTVSGGGYIGSWLSAWIHRAGGVGPVEEALGGENEPQPVKHLREFSNFLTPKRGLFGPDTQTWVATYLRNLILNLVILLSVFSAVLLLPYFVVWAFASLPTQAGRTWSLFNLSPFDALVIVLFFVGVTMVSFNLSWTPQREAPWYAQRKAVYWLITAPTCLALWLALAGIERLAAMSWVDVSICFSVAYAALWLYGGVLQWILTRRGWFGRQPPAVSKPDQLSLASRLLIIATAAIAGAVGGCLFKAAAAGAVALTQLGQHYLATAGASSYPVLAMSFGFPLMLACAALTVVLHIGLVGRGFSSSFHLEWWARLGASASSFAVGWVALFAVALFGPVLVAFIGGWIGKTFTAGWLFSTLAGVFLGKSSLTGGAKANRWLELFVRITPYVFILGLALMLSYFIALWLLGPTRVDCGFVEMVRRHADAIGSAEPRCFYAAFALLTLVGVGLAARVNVNLFSLYHAYRMRLIRAYLGASNPDRRPQPFTDFDRNDDIHLPELKHTSSGKPQRPLHLINTALNLVRVQKKAWQQRKSASFVLGPLHTGYSLEDPMYDGSYRPTEQYANEGYHGRHELFSLGSALTISGAAASPNMGYHSSPGMTFLLTVFNIRLGRWCPNPSEPAWQRNEPKVGLGYLLMELLGLTDNRSHFVYLSDGGHFENLGLYELVRRRCRLIVVSDCGADAAFTFDDLANAQRKCATDLRVEIDIDVSALRRQSAGYARDNFAIGRIRYGCGEPDGSLVLLKPALTGCEAVDVLNYASVEKDFPQVSTIDQWFDEAQFESYRKLGFSVCSHMLDKQPFIATALKELTRIGLPR